MTCETCQRGRMSFTPTGSPSAAAGAARRARLHTGQTHTHNFIPCVYQCKVHSHVGVGSERCIYLGVSGTHSQGGGWSQVDDIGTGEEDIKATSHYRDKVSYPDRQGCDHVFVIKYLICVCCSVLWGMATCYWCVSLLITTESLVSMSK